MVDEGVVADLDLLGVLEENSGGDFYSFSPPLQPRPPHVMAAGDKGEQVQPSFYDFFDFQNHGGGLVRRAVRKR
jgi:hypothetical protein